MHLGRTRVYAYVHVCIKLHEMLAFRKMCVRTNKWMIPIPTCEVLVLPKGVMNKGFININKNRRISSFTTKQNPCIYNDGIIKHVSCLRHVERL